MQTDSFLTEKVFENFGAEMTRHSKNANARPFVTSAERSKASASGGADEGSNARNRVPFGYCCLTLRPAKCPLASLQGWIYDKDAVVEYLVTERERLRGKHDIRERHRTYLDSQTEKLSNKRSLAEISKASGSSFWVSPPTESVSWSSSCKSEGNVTGSSVPLCPISREKLRLKDLIPVKFERSADSEGMYCCAISKRAITHQQALLIKPSGVVVLESVLKQQGDSAYVQRCPITGVELGPTDVIQLQKGCLVG